MYNIGPYHIDSRTILAPMAGVTDRPFRELCRQQGAGLAVSEMVTADTSLWHSRKSRFRLDHEGESGIRMVQIAGGDPAMLAEAARLNAEQGAQIVDINMGCPAKKVCNKAAGSALLRDEKLVAQILSTVVAAVDVPVTLKIRTGWDPANRNGLQIARIAEACGVQALAVHGRTRACGFRGQAEYDTIAAIKSALTIPVFANGDITTAQQAAAVLQHTGADAVMIGRAAQGQPWIFGAINHYLATGEELAPPSLAQIQQLLSQHIEALHQFYGDYLGVRITRKHVGWYLASLGDDSSKQFRQQFNSLETTQAQLQAISERFAQLQQQGPQAA